jgi:hypothetical protein
MGPKGYADRAIPGQQPDAGAIARLCHVALEIGWYGP